VKIGIGSDHGGFYFRALTVLVLVWMCSPAGARIQTTGTIDFGRMPKHCLHNVRIVTDKRGKSAYTIRDLSYKAASDPFITDIVLSFNTPSERLHRDDMKHYRIPYSDYALVTGGGTLGGGCAQFYKKEHWVAIQTVKGAWLGDCGDLGSFTIEFRLYAKKFQDGSMLFSRVGYMSGRKRGIEIQLKDRRVVAFLYGIFNTPDGEPLDIILDRGSTLRLLKWYHFSLSFDRLSGKLAKYLDGEEDGVRYVTKSGQPYDGVYTPSFGKPDQSGLIECLDLPQAYIGKDYFGLIDEFRISYRKFEDVAQYEAIAERNYHAVNEVGKIPFNVEGVITSPVYSFQGTGTGVTEFRWRERSAKNTFVWMQFRTSDRFFDGDSTEVKWFRVDNGQRNIYLKRDENGYLRGKYYQWRAHLVSSPDGKAAPSISGMEMDYRLDLPPDPPIFVEAAGAGDRTVVLKWKKNTENDIMGYKIYYGIVPGRYDGIITVVNGKRIVNPSDGDNTVRVKITNEVIEENRERDAWGKLNYPVLKNTVLYYFAVSAYDSYKPDTSYNHESRLSEQVTARPYEGSEIR
jgi:hypothetical protein